MSRNRGTRMTVADRRASRTVRTRLYYEQGGECGFCQCWVPRTKATYDHLLPRAKGGPATWGNGIMACAACNSAKGDTILADQRHKLRRYAVAS